MDVVPTFASQIKNVPNDVSFTIDVVHKKLLKPKLNQTPDGVAPIIFRKSTDLLADFQTELRRRRSFNGIPLGYCYTCV